MTSPPKTTVLRADDSVFVLSTQAPYSSFRRFVYARKTDADYDDDASDGPSGRSPKAVAARSAFDGARRRLDAARAARCCGTVLGCWGPCSGP